MVSDRDDRTAQTRRAFLATLWRGAGSSVVLASLPSWSEAMPPAGPPEQPGRFRFPQGLASGDPAPDSVVLWTRVEAASGATVPIDVRLDVAEDAAFTRLVATERLRATAESDFTLRVLVAGLAPATTYHYRFTAGADRTLLPGRTRTAPRPGDDRPARFAFASCQSYEAGYYGVWRALVTHDEAAPPAEQLDAVIHLGDFIYEALGYGAARRVAPFPDGGRASDAADATSWARTLADYRHLYKTYLADPDLQAARARFPFIVTWDDHEFSDDSWQAVATYGNRDVPMPARKVAANRAWFEFIPVRLSGAASPAGVANEARDFAEPTAGAGAGPEAGTAGDDADAVRRAVASIAIYRTVRWGRHAEIVLTDTRSYRSDHPVPDAVGVQVSTTGRYFLPRPLVETFDAGRTAGDGAPPATIRVGARDVPNLRREAEPGTMLGARQKAWWKAVMRASDATWKLWASSVPVQPVWFDADRLLPGSDTAVFSTDAWDGYPGERRELLRFLADAGIANVVVLSGDNHNTFAGTLAPDHPSAPRDGVAVEFSIAGISSPSIFEAFVGAIPAGDPMRGIVLFDDTRFGGRDPRCPALNVTLRHGVLAALQLQQTGDVRRALAARNPAHNAHLAYMDTTANGIGLLHVDGEAARGELWTFAPPLEREARRLRVARFTRPRWGPGDRVALEAPVIEGVAPFPDDRTG